MRVLLVTPDFPPERGGIQQVAAGLAAHLDADARVVTLRSRRNGAATPGVERAWSPRPSGPAAIAALNAAAVRVGLSHPADVILSLHVFAAPAALALSRALRRPWVQWVHAMELPQKPWLARRTLRRASAVVAVSRYSRALALDAGADPRRVHVVHPGVDARQGRRSTGRRSRPTILTVSRLAERYKGHDTLARAMPLVSARLPGAQWIVIGDGPLRRPLEALARCSGANARFLGGVSDGERDRWLDRAHVFAMPSRLPGGSFAGEGFGIVFLEAGLHELPVVAGDVAGARDAVVHGETGLLVDPTDHVAVAGALVELLADSRRAARLGRAGAARALDHSWPAVAGRVRQVLEQVALGG